MGDRIDSFVDEAGDPTLFGRRRGSGVIVGKEGCSKFFIIGKLEVGDPARLSAELTKLRRALLADPYFAGVPSFKPEGKRTALGFHAKDDVPEVRYAVFKLLAERKDDLRFHAVVADKTVTAAQEIEKRRLDPKTRYQKNSLYDDLIRQLYRKFHRIADEHYVCIARREKHARNRAMREALEHAENDFERSFGFRCGAWRVEVSDPRAAVCLQATDYFLWAVQRFYERHEARFMDVLWPRIGEIHDLHLGGGTGTFFRGEMTSMTYQAASGAGAAHMRELAAQMEAVGEAVRAPLAASLLPWIDRPLDGGRSREEGNNILGNEPPLPIDGACVQVGSMRCHAQACTIKLREDRPIDEIEALIDGAQTGCGWSRAPRRRPSRSSPRPR